MNSNIFFDFTVSKENKTIMVIREFAANPDRVWEAWTKPELLDQWWAPKPWKTNTVSMDFRDGGTWLYYMQGPDGSRHYCRADYKLITVNKSFEGLDAFCDEQGNINHDFPRMNWKTEFSKTSIGTKVDIKITFSSLEDLEKIIEMGFKEGFTSALGNLDQYLEAQFKLRNELKTDNKSRVTTYLNFPGNTEEAFNFYRTVFGTEFSGKGIQRFGDIPVEAGHPPVADNVKKMVLHVELPILGGHLLMATDSPKEMGFALTTGNNMHICLEPSTRVETKKLFDAISKGGNITMPLEDMFFGTYFGTCTDRFGINWMFSCAEK
ncbi:MAG: SRPBCC domain-containing protein [Bacteroidota bacterium]